MKQSPKANGASASISAVSRSIREGKIKHIVVMVGAGISVAAGIPDFRSPGTGLYYNLQKYSLPYPEAVFDIRYFRNNPLPFFQLSKELLPGLYKPTRTHLFIKQLHDAGLLQRCYTQNIDGLERIAGIPATSLVEAHGTFASARCIDCSKSYSETLLREQIITGQTPVVCPCGGLIKPDIVFYGEGLPQRFHTLSSTDLPKCDLLLVLGTSLAVYPFAGLVNEVQPGTPRILVNREAVSLFAALPEDSADGEGVERTDFALLGDCDELCHELAEEWGLPPLEETSKGSLLESCLPCLPSFGSPKPKPAVAQVEPLVPPQGAEEGRVQDGISISGVTTLETTHVTTVETAVIVETMAVTTVEAAAVTTVETAPVGAAETVSVTTAGTVSVTTVDATAVTTVETAPVGAAGSVAVTTAGAVSVTTVQAAAVLPGAVTEEEEDVEKLEARINTVTLESSKDVIEPAADAVEVDTTEKVDGSGKQNTIEINAIAVKDGDRCVVNSVNEADARL